MAAILDHLLIEKVIISSHLVACDQQHSSIIALAAL